MIKEKEITSSLADYIFELQLKDHSPEVTHQFKRALMDYLCVTITGSKMPVVKSILDYVETIDSNKACSVYGSTIRLSPINAAFVNGTSSHSLDFDDGHTHGSIHIGGVVFPAVLAVAEQYKCSPKEIVKATIIGYEVAGRLAGALHPNVWKRGLHNTPVIGIFGGVAAVSVLLGSTRDELLDALGQAGSYSGGLFEFLGEGADIKRLHPGKAARDAILCSELARRGISGPKKVFEGKNGFIKAFADNQINVDRLYENLYTDYEINNIYFKPYPCCRHLHGPIEAVKQLLDTEQIDINDIADIDVGTYKVGAKHSHKKVAHLLDAQMSIPCAVSLALAYGNVNVKTFETSNLQSNEVQNLIEKVNVRIDAECEQLYPAHRPSLLIIKMKNGKELQKFIKDPKGESDRPLTDDELEEKFTNNCKGIISDQQIRSIIDATWKFDELNHLNELLI